MIRCQPPALVVTSSYVFIVTAGGQAMSGASCFCECSVSFSTIAAPTVSSISPRVGAGGASVPVLTLTGSGYGASVSDITQITLGVAGVGLTCVSVGWSSAS